MNERIYSDDDWNRAYCELGKIAARLIAIPGGSLVGEKLPNGKMVVGFRFNEELKNETSCISF